MDEKKGRIVRMEGSVNLKQAPDTPNSPFDFIQHTQVFWELKETPSDRVCAVLRGAMIHSQLEQAIQKKLIVNETNAEALIGFDGVLGNFRLLNDLAHAMGMISDDVWNDLKYVRKIRNAFAHTATVKDSKGKTKRLTFKSDSVSSFADLLRCPKIVLRQDMSEGANKEYEKRKQKGNVLDFPALPEPTDPRVRFEWTCTCLTDLLLGLDQYDAILIAPRKPRDFLHFPYRGP